MKHESNMTSKGQVTVPKDIRDALGLGAGDLVRFELDENGNAWIVKADDATQFEKRKMEIRQRLAEIRSKYKPLAEFAGMDGLAYQHWIRGDGPEV